MTHDADHDFRTLHPSRHISNGGIFDPQLEQQAQAPADRTDTTGRAAGRQWLEVLVSLAALLIVAAFVTGVVIALVR